MTLDQKVSINPCVGIVYNERYSLRIMLKIKGTQITIHPSIHRFQNAFLRCPTPRLLCFLSSHWPSLKFLSFMAFLMPSIQLFFGLPRAVFCFGIHFNAIFGNLPSTILWTWPYHVSWFCSISFKIVSSSPISCLIVTFLILSFPDFLEDLLRTSISVASVSYYFLWVKLPPMVILFTPYFIVHHNKMHSFKKVQYLFNETRLKLPFGSFKDLCVCCEFLWLCISPTAHSWRISSVWLCVLEGWLLWLNMCVTHRMSDTWRVLCTS